MIAGPEEQKQLRSEWRLLWQQERLIADRTEFLAVYPSDDPKRTLAHGKLDKNTMKDHDEQQQQKRGGFADLLHMYRGRFIAILEDEQMDNHDFISSMARGENKQMGEEKVTSIMALLEDKYGREKVEQLKAGNLKQYPVSQQLVMLKDFLEWFRNHFPYFYDRCSICGASAKDDKDNDNIECSNDNENDNDDDDEDSAQAKKHTFVGYVYPNNSELAGKASRTELYQCHKCHGWTRFPRFNSAQYVMDHQRGRCGEYSMLLYRFLRSLDHEARWVVDWADHVWAEVYLPASFSWIHLDPCEAAVDENMIYHGWGKKQTYIIAFYAPPKKLLLEEPQKYHHRRRYGNFLHGASRTVLIEDVTTKYTPDSTYSIQRRREESRIAVQNAISEATKKLQDEIDEYVIKQEHQLSCFMGRP